MAQTKNQAIEQFLKKMSKVHGIGSVILVPEFEGNDNNGWTPTNVGVRTTKKSGTSFIRLGSVVMGAGLSVKVRLTNAFQPTAQLEDTLDMLGITPGSKVPGKLIVHERLEPFRRTNADADLKWADKNAGIRCEFTGEYNGVTYDSPAPIYRRIEHTDNMSAEDIRIQHTNGTQISEHARKVWAASQLSNTGTPSLAGATA